MGKIDDLWEGLKKIGGAAGELAAWSISLPIAIVAGILGGSKAANEVIETGFAIGKGIGEGAVNKVTNPAQAVTEFVQGTACLLDGKEEEGRKRLSSAATKATFSTLSTIMPGPGEIIEELNIGLPNPNPELRP